VAIAFNAASSATGTGVSSLTFAHTVAAGGILVVSAQVCGGTMTVTGVTYNAVALTQLLADTDLSGAGVKAKNSAWLIHNPTTGSSQNIVVSFSTSAEYAGGVGTSYTGVVNSSAAAAHRTVYSAGDGEAGSGVDVTVTDSVNADMVYASSSTYGQALDAGSGMTGRVFLVFSGNYSSGAEDKVATGASTVMSFSQDIYCTNIAFALIPSAAATFIPSKPMNSQMRSVLAQ
jgi:hypothetical protein